MGSRIPDRSINEGGGIRTHTLKALVPKTNAAAITPLPRKEPLMRLFNLLHNQFSR